nr:unnamed protein product [Spirometra erinaceieuropaei]
MSRSDNIVKVSVDFYGSLCYSRDELPEDDTRGVEWNAKVRARPCHPPAPSLASGLLDSVLTLGPSGRGGESVVDAVLSAVKRQRTEDYTTHHSVSSRPTSAHAYSMDSAYDEHILTIGQLQDDIKALKRQLQLKDAELLKKNQTISDLKSEILEMETSSRERLLKYQDSAEDEINRLKETIRTLQREKVELSSRSKKRRMAYPNPSYTHSPLTLSPLRMPPSPPPKPAKLLTSASTPSLFRRLNDEGARGDHRREATPTSTPPGSPHTEGTEDADSNASSRPRRHRGVLEETDEAEGDSAANTPAGAVGEGQDATVAAAGTTTTARSEGGPTSPSLSSSSEGLSPVPPRNA